MQKFQPVIGIKISKPAVPKSLPKMLVTSLACLIVFIAIAFNQGCEYTGTFKNEKGNFELSWCYPNSDEIQFRVSLAGNAYIAIGFGGSMYEADIISGWVDANGKVVINDYYSSVEGKPKEDTVLGGTNDVIPISGFRTKRYSVNATESSNTASVATTLVFSRKLNTGDQYDKVISLTEPNDMIYAWGVSDSSGLVYHADNHNHIFVDFSKPNGIPDTEFGKEESGLLSRNLIKNAYYGTLSTFQSVAAGAENVVNVPYGSVADFADDVPSTGKPLILLSELERSVVNLATNPKCSLHVITTPTTVSEFQHPELFDVMTKPRTTLIGHLELVPEAELAAARATYVAKHPKSQAWIEFDDFHLYRFQVEDVYAVGGFGNTHYIGWISPEQYLSVQP